MVIYLQDGHAPLEVGGREREREGGRERERGRKGGRNILKSQVNPLTFS